MGIDEHVLAQCANSKQKSTQSVEREQNHSEGGRSQFLPRPQHQVSEHEDLDVHEQHKEARHEQQSHPVTQQESTKQINAQPVEEDGDDLLQKIRF